MERGMNMELVFLYVNLSRSNFIKKSGFIFYPISLFFIFDIGENICQNWTRYIVPETK